MNYGSKTITFHPRGDAVKEFARSLTQKRQFQEFTNQVFDAMSKCKGSIVISDSEGEILRLPITEVGS